MSTFQQRVTPVRAAVTAEVNQAMQALKSVSVLDKTMDISRLYPAFKSVLAMSVDDPCESSPSTADRLVKTLRSFDFQAYAVPSNTMVMGMLSKNKDVSAVSESGSVEVLYSALTGIALIFETEGF